MARPYKCDQVTEKKNAKKKILLLVCELFVYICIELSTNLNALTMKKTVNAYEFTDAMTLNGFSRNGSLALFNYLEQYEEDTEHELEFDPVAFRHEFTEYKNVKDIAREYGEEYNNLDYLEQSTQVIKFDGGIIILDF